MKNSYDVDFIRGGRVSCATIQYPHEVHTGDLISNFNSDAFRVVEVYHRYELNTQLVAEYEAC